MGPEAWCCVAYGVQYRGSSAGRLLKRNKPSLYKDTKTKEVKNEKYSKKINVSYGFKLD